MKYKNVIKSIATLGPLGYFKAPGTVGSIAALVGAYLIQKYISDLFIHALVIFIFGFLALIIIRSTVKQFASSDPQEIIIDEVIGCFVACYGLPWKMSIIIMSFLFFRFFDITKLLGISYLEKACERSSAILIDDLVAGLFANIAVRFLL